MVRRSGPYYKLRTRVCRASRGGNAAGVEKHHPRSENEKSTLEVDHFFLRTIPTLTQDTGMQHSDLKRLVGGTAGRRAARARASERLPRKPRPAY